MDYMGWILSIYDECEKRYKKNQIKNKINGPKDFLKRCLKKENIYASFLLATLIIGMTCILFLYLIGILKNIQYYMLFLIVGFELGIIPTLYQYEPILDEYEKKITILVEILEEHNLNKKEIKKLLLRKTRSVLYRTKTIVISLIGTLVSSSGLFKYVIEINKEEIKTVITTLIIGLLILVILLSIVYQIAIVIPNNRIIRKQKFHNLLNILYVYELQEESVLEEEGMLEKINIKEIIGKIKEST